jgi:hypothetical protein
MHLLTPASTATATNPCSAATRKPAKIMDKGVKRAVNAQDPLTLVLMKITLVSTIAFSAMPEQVLTLKNRPWVNTTQIE